MMPTLYRYLFPAMWLSWLAYWWISAHDTKATVRHESASFRLSYLVPLICAGVLLTGRLRMPLLDVRFLPAGDWTYAIGTIVMAAGLLFSVWGRRHLGTNWSATVTIKQGHELVTTGPYRVVRHPIYTGMLVAFVGLALSIGEWRGVLAVLLAGYSFWRKLRLEERWMIEQFGEAYRSYSRRTPALIPFLL